MSSLKFGTSGLRGLVTELLGEPAALWTAAFLRYLENSTPKCARTLYIGRDLRSSSPAIAGDCAAAAANRGWLVVDCGALPTLAPTTVAIPLIIQAWERLRGTITRIKDQLGLIKRAPQRQMDLDQPKMKTTTRHDAFCASRLSEGHRALFWTRHN